MYIVAILLPPLAVLLKGKPIQAVLNVFLTLMLWVPGVIHAIMVVNASNADARNKRLENTIRESAQAQTAAAIRMQQAQAEAQAAAAQAEALAAKREVAAEQAKVDAGSDPAR